MFRLNRAHFMVSTLAHCLAMEAFDHVEFVTDFRGLEIAERLGWRFTSLIPALECLRDCKTPHVWARGKLEALKMQRKPVCHLDFDVYLHKRLPTRMKQARILAQSVDWPGYYLGANMERGRVIAGLPEGQMAYNAGLIGGCDIAVLQDYVQGALALADKFIGHEEELSEGTCISMLVEQYWLGLFARQEGLRVETILPLNPTRKEWHEAGYTHLHGDAKRDPYYVKNTSRRLREQFPAAFAAFEAGWKEIEEDFSE